MDGRLKHLVLTRFNLAIRFGCERRRNSLVPDQTPWLDEDYLKKRFEIFEKYTFSSMNNQTDKNFEWIVMFHKDTPKRFKMIVENYKKQMSQFVPLFLDDSECERVNEVLKDFIQKNYNSEYRNKIITTRIDNDDAIHSTCIEDIKNQFKEIETSTILTYINGMQYDMMTGNVLKYNYQNNHFISLCDLKNNHILMYNHAFISDDVCPIKAICTDIPLWVEIITQNNYSNAMKWRFSTIGIDYKIKEEYPMLDLKWKSKEEWRRYILKAFFLVFYFRGKGLLRMIKEKYVKRNTLKRYL